MSGKRGDVADEDRSVSFCDDGEGDGGGAGGKAAFLLVVIFYLVFFACIVLLILVEAGEEGLFVKGCFFVVTLFRPSSLLFCVAIVLSRLEFARVRSPKKYFRSMSEVSVILLVFPRKNVLNILSAR